MVKSISNEENRFKRINVQKIGSLKDLLNKPINEVTFNLKSLSELNEISKILIKTGSTSVKIKINDKDKYLNFHLENKRYIDRKTLNLLKNRQISTIIS